MMLLASIIAYAQDPRYEQLIVRNVSDFKINLCLAFLNLEYMIHY